VILKQCKYIYILQCTQLSTIMEDFDPV